MGGYVVLTVWRFDVVDTDTRVVSASRGGSSGSWYSLLVPRIAIKFTDKNP